MSLSSRLPRLWLLLCFAVAWPTHSLAAADPSTIPTASLRDSLAKALGISGTQVVEAQGYGLRTANGIGGVVLGRYHESSGRYTFPVLAVYHDCPGGTCQTLLRLGQAVDRIAPIALVDLDTPVADVPRLQPILPRMAVPQPEKPPRYPVLLIGGEPQQREPSSPAAQPRHSEQHLIIVSLQSATAPTQLHSLTLSERWAEPADAQIRPPRRVGHQIEGILLGRSGAEQVLIIRERDIDSRYSRGLRPAPRERRFRLVAGRFVAQPEHGSPID